MSKTKQKYLTWGELKAFCNTLTTPLDLNKHVQWWGDERGGKINSVERLEEDYVTTDYGCEPLSVQEKPIEGEEQYPVTHPKGTPILFTE